MAARALGASIVGHLILLAGVFAGIPPVGLIALLGLSLLLDLCLWLLLSRQ